MIDDSAPENPYESPEIPNETETSVALAEPHPKKYPLWTVLAICLVTLVLMIQVSVIFGAIAVWAVEGQIRMLGPDDVTTIMASRIGFVLMVLPTQLCFVIPAAVAAIGSSVPFRERLGMVRGNWPIALWITGAIATPIVGIVMNLFISADESESLSAMTESFRLHLTSGFAIPLFLMVAILPCICEEFLFRGYIQTRFAQRMAPPVAIAISAVMFAAAHLDPIHVLGVIPIGLWLGFLRYASGSIFPAMLGHAVNNSLAILGIMPEGATQTDSPGIVIATLMVLLAMPCLIYTIIASRRTANAAPVSE